MRVILSVMCFGVLLTSQLCLAATPRVSQYLTYVNTTEHDLETGIKKTIPQDYAELVRRGSPIVDIKFNADDNTVLDLTLSGEVRRPLTRLEFRTHYLAQRAKEMLTNSNASLVLVYTQSYGAFAVETIIANEVQVLSASQRSFRQLVN